jgi:sugar phosphate permease
VSAGTRIAPAPAYRWVVLAVGVGAQGAFSAVSLGLPSIAPALRTEYQLSIAQLGVALAAVVAGMVMTMLAWGVLADRIGERTVMTAGLAGSGAAVLLASRTTGAVALIAALALAGAFGASVNAASGRAVAGWFSPSQRGLAMGIRQSALPLGGGLSAAALPSVAAAGGARRALVLLGTVCLAGALLAAVGMRDDPTPQADERATSDEPSPLRDGRIWRLAAVSAVLCVPQLALLSFVALYLHDERGLSPVTAGGVLGAVLVAGALARIAAGVAADRRAARLPLLRSVATALAVALVLGVLLLPAPTPLTAAGLAMAAVLGLSWNGLAFLATAETAAPSRRGTALGLQNTAVTVSAALAPVAFGLAVTYVGWTAAFAVLPVAPLVALAILAPLVHAERRTVPA